MKVETCKYCGKEPAFPLAEAPTIRVVVCCSTGIKAQYGYLGGFTRGQFAPNRGDGIGGASEIISPT